MLFVFSDSVQTTISTQWAVLIVETVLIISVTNRYGFKYAVYIYIIWLEQGATIYHNFKQHTTTFDSSSGCSVALS
jgi:hypothetical protein